MTAATRAHPDRGDKTAGRRGASRDTPDDTRQPRNTRQEQERRTSGGKAGREGGERDTDGLAPGEWRRGTRQQAGSRERTKKRYINI